MDQRGTRGGGVKIYEVSFTTKILSAGKSAKSFATMTTLENSREMVKLNFFYSQGEKWRGSLRAKLFSNLRNITWLKKRTIYKEIQADERARSEF